jgi:hypothetical protein
MKPPVLLRKKGEADQQTIRNRCLPPPAPVSVNQSRKPTPVKGPEPDRSECPSRLTKKLRPKFSRQNVENNS